MASEYLNTVLIHLRRLARARQADGISDGRLLEQFALSQDEAAFEALLERHGPMVLGVCRRCLRDANDVDDAFQATFLVLVSQARSIRKRGSVGSWLYGVAQRIASRARQRKDRCRFLERQADELPATGMDPATESARRELRPIVDAELQRLPEKYRAPLVLCHLEGRTNAEAAALLRWPLGTVQNRLFRGRELLRARLIRRGLTLSGGVLAPGFAADAVAAVPATLAATTRRAAVLFAAGRSTGAIPVQVAALTSGILRTMLVTRITTVVATMVAIAVLSVAAGFCAQHVLVGKQARTKGEDSVPSVAAQGAATVPDVAPRPEESRAWYVLRQPNTFGLFHGMPVRLGKVLVPSRRSGPLWNGVDEGGRLELDIAVEGGVTGEVFVGFFTDAKWSAEPVQARRFPGPGRYTVDRLMAGKYHLGAMIGLPPQPGALGVQREWPGPVEIKAGQTSRVRLLLSPKFKDNPNGHGLLPREGYAGQWKPVDPSRLITVRTVDEEGRPVPFCLVKFEARPPVDAMKLTGSDDQGYAYCDQIDSAFSLIVQRFEAVPETLASRSEYRRLAKVYRSEDRPVIPITWGPFPVGTGKVTGRVRDQRGRPLTEFYINVQREEGERLGRGDYTVLSYQVPVIDAEGRYEVGGLPPGEYQVRAFGFDIQAHEFSFSGPKVTLTKEDLKAARVDLELEAKELYYGRAVYPDGTPISAGVAIAWIEKYTPEQVIKHGGWSGRDTNCRLENDGSFRIALLRKERGDFLKNAHGLVEIQAYRREGNRTYGDKMGEVPLDKLSRDSAHPARLVFPRKAEKKPASSAEKPPPSAKAPIAGEKTGDLELLATDGRTHLLADYRGKPVLLNVFTTWCGPCQEELPHLIELHQRCADKGLIVLAVSRGEEPAVVEAYARRQRLPFPVLVDPMGTALTLFKEVDGRAGVPTNVLLDGELHVVFAETGYTAEKFAKLQDAIERTLASAGRRP